MPIATWPVNGYHVKSCSLGTAHPSILTILKLFTTLLQGFTHISFSFFAPTIAFYFTLQVAVVPLTLSLKTDPWMVSPIRRFDWYAHTLPAERPILIISFRVSTQDKCRGRFQKIMRLSSQLQFCCSSILLKLYPEATQDTQRHPNNGYT